MSTWRPQDLESALEERADLRELAQATQVRFLLASAAGESRGA